MAKFSFTTRSKVANSNDALKFDLYVKTRQIQQVADALQTIQTQPLTQQQRWLAEHESTVSDLLDSFMDEASGVFDGLTLDREAMDLSMQFVTNVREVMASLQGMIGSQGGPLDQGSEAGEDNPFDI